MRKMWLVYDRHGQCQGWFGSEEMAQAVAEKMVAISADRQVICVTHLPQIAAAADYHYLVRKSVADGRTHTSVGELDLQGRTGELSRMISGADGVTQESDAYAASMLQAAAELRHKSSIAAGDDCLNKSETN